MTYRKIVSYGLIAGLTYTEMQKLAPGFVIDMYLMKQRYDDEQHQLKRKSPYEYQPIF